MTLTYLKSYKKPSNSPYIQFLCSSTINISIFTITTLTRLPLSVLLSSFFDCSLKRYYVFKYSCLTAL